ncbi:MAG: hypothetical protein ACFFAO_00120 [Candidatus Hermodarchaeota archaeon]
MKVKRRNKVIVFFTFSIIIFSLVFLLNSKVAYAQAQYNESEQSITMSLNFSTSEFSNEVENMTNKTSIDIDLPSSTWNLTDIHVNFTDIEFNRELRIIEDEADAYNSIDKINIQGLSVQLNITDPTILYGVYIYGRAINPKLADTVIFEIQGYDSLNNRPDGVASFSQALNMSEDLTWHYQNFTTAQPLSKGNYSLVLRQSTIQLPTTRYVWYYSYNEPNYPDLHISFEQGGIWSPGYSGTPQLYKLDQKLNYTFNPNEINMRAKINGDNYPVLNGIGPNKGNFSFTSKDYSSNTDTLSISIENNKSSSLLFNASYWFNIKNTFSAGGTVLTRQSFNNTWTVKPKITRYSSNYSVSFDYPQNWDNVNISKDGQKLTDPANYTDDGDVLYIYNNTISNNAIWEITATTEKIPFEATPQLSSYSPGQLLRVSVNVPSSESVANLTLIILDPDGYFEYNNTIKVPSGTDTEILTYDIPSNAIGGSWIALTFWNNYTDAGVESASFQIGTSDGGSNSGGGGNGTTIVTGLDPQLVIITVIIIAVGVLAGLTTYQLGKRHKSLKAAHRQKIYNKYMDILNLNYIMVSARDSGLNIYEQMISGKELDPTLISGFLQAIRSFGIDLTGSEEQAQSVRLEYQHLKILMSEFKDFRIINIFADTPSKDFLDSLEPLSHEINKYYGKSIKNFKGDVSIFKGIKELLERHLNISLVYPLNIYTSEYIKLDSDEKSLVNKVLTLMKKKNLDHFYVTYMLGQKEFDVKNAELILKLIQRKVFRPMD